MIPETKINIKKGDWIFWRWITNEKTFAKSFIQNIVPSGDDIILELTDCDIWSKYPTRVLSKEIEVREINQNNQL